MKLWSILISSGLSFALHAALAPEQLAKLPPPAQKQVSFKQEIKPILEASCIKCHGRGKDKGGFAIDTRETFLKGGDTGPAVLAGKSAESYLVELVSGLNPDAVMPEKGSKLTSEQVGLIRAWIDQGVQWDDTVTFAKLPPLNLHPRKPELPDISGVEHPVDRFLFTYFANQKYNAHQPVDDRTFARRAYLDSIGLLPTPSELDQFLGDTRPDKRAQLVRQLLGRDLDYAQHWLTFWNDALRNDYKGTGYIDGGRKQITGWLFSALASNKPYNQFVSELINPNPDSEGFTKGIVWRGVVNASQTPQMQAAQNISQVFMGVNLKCASCHDSFINDWTLADAYGLASIYADGPLEMFKCDVPTGKTASMRFIYPELGEISSESDRKARLQHLAEVVTSDKNARLTRTIVNRLWARLLGRGLIEPVDEMDNPAWNQDLLDWLASDLVENGFNLKRTLELIMTSTAYQLPSVPQPEIADKNFAFRGPLVRRLSAEQFLDAISEVTGLWYENPAAQIPLGDKALDANFANAPVQPKWIWKDANAAKATEATTIYLRKFFELPERPDQATIIATCDNGFRMFINGTEVGSSKDFGKPTVIDARKHLRAGINLVAIEAVNWPGSPNNPEADQRNAGGLIAYARIRSTDSSGKESTHDFGTDSTWLWSAVGNPGWQKPDYVAAHWERASELGAADLAPWKLGAALATRVSNAALQGQTRAALVTADPLMVALGRPNREQVITTRASAATTLQALELTNGSTLDAKLKQAAEKLGSEIPTSEQLVTELYIRALGRKPTVIEASTTRELLGEKAETHDIEDFLWAMVMLPEFQLIY
jgi:mono/diheme cytochrome c family protein